jgi:glutamate synthase domain-containing protein 3
MPSKISLDMSYDDLTDVLYVSTSRPNATKNMEEVAGLVLRYDPKTHEPVAATIIDYQEYWQSHRQKLAARSADFFRISTKDAERALESVNG